jgi:hypothetical protein
VCFIFVTSCLDAAMMVIYETLYEEQNPMSLFVLKTCGTSGFVTVKLVMTVIVSAFVLFLWKMWQEAAQLTAVVIALFQTCLMCYLFF